MIIEDNRNTTTYRFYELKRGDAFFFATEDNEEIADTAYGVCMKIDDVYYYSFNMNEALDTTDDEIVFPVNAKLILY